MLIILFNKVVYFLNEKIVGGLKCKIIEVVQ